MASKVKATGNPSRTITMKSDNIKIATSGFVIL